jgi:hypothetical protein
MLKGIHSFVHFAAKCRAQKTLSSSSNGEKKVSLSFLVESSACASFSLQRRKEKERSKSLVNWICIV